MIWLEELGRLPAGGVSMTITLQSDMSTPVARLMRDVRVGALTGGSVEAMQHILMRLIGQERLDAEAA